MADWADEMAEYLEEYGEQTEADMIADREADWSEAHAYLGELGDRYALAHADDR